MFSFLKYHQTVFQSVCNSFVFPPVLNESFASSVAFSAVGVPDFGPSNSLQWYLIVLICISLITYDVEHLFMHLFAISVFFGRVNIKIFSPFLFIFIKIFMYLFEREKAHTVGGSCGRVGIRGRGSQADSTLIKELRHWAQSRDLP